jgi:deoxycytidine triphosphate deaminase
MAEKGSSNSLFGDDKPGIILEHEVRGLVAQGQLISAETFNKSCLEPSSYDVRVGKKGVLGGSGTTVDLTSGHIELGPGAYAGIISQEKILLPLDVIGRIGSKRALSYEGVILLTGALIDPGYEGHLLFGLYNASQRKVFIRFGKKVCNIVFERLAQKSERGVSGDLALRNGDLPEEFIDQFANMEVLPWMQISERVKQIEQITSDIIDLKARYEDVLEPIKQLTGNVNNLTNDVRQLAEQGKTLGAEVTTLKGLIGENGRQINELTVSLKLVTQTVSTLDDTRKSLDSDVKTLREKFSRFSFVVYVFWAIILLFAGGYLKEFIK